MKNKPYFILIAAVIFITPTSNSLLNANNKRNLDIDSVTVIDKFPNFYQSGDYYFGGQPSREQLEWLQEQGVTLIVNLRSEKEMEKVIAEGFDEKLNVTELGMKYVQIPMEGASAYNTYTLADFSSVLNENNGKVFIHCYSCYRVTCITMAYLIGYENTPVNDAVNFGKKMKYSSPLEDLLGRKMTCYIE